MSQESTYVNIIEQNEGVIQNNLLFVGINASERAEAAFKQMIGEQGEATMSDEDMAVHLNNGYFEEGGWILSLSHPTAEVLEKV